MALKQHNELRALYSRLDPNQETVVYCQSGVRASETAVILRDLGFTRVKVYEPSWLGYAGVLNAPAENEVFVNVGALNGQISALQGKLRALEAEVSKLQAARH
jgi:thiosulfate/3-mercaptopyruvate sulfurtransferase